MSGALAGSASWFGRPADGLAWMERGLAALETAIDRSFCPYDFIAVHCPFLEPLRGRPEFGRILLKAARQVAEFMTGPNAPPRLG